MAEAALYPGAQWRPLGTQTEDRMKAHDILCLHTMVGYLVSTDRYFRTGNGAGYAGTESTYGVGGKWGPDADANLDGVVWQWQDRAFTADANLYGNPRVISIETADNAPASASDIEPWTPKQFEAIARLLAWESSPAAHAQCPSTWACHTVGIPLVLIPDSKPGRRGVGYHQQGIDPWRVDGGELWSQSFGKECPTKRRVAQIPAVIARAQAIREGDIMQFTDPVPGAAPDPDGTALIVQEALLRGNTGYRYVIEGGPIENRVSLLETRVGPDTDAHAGYAYAAVTSGGIVDQRLDALEAAVVKLMPPDGALLERIQAIESVLLKLKEALS